MRDQHQQAFLEEAAELMTVLEQTLLDLEKDNTNKELIGQAFRALHTLKGSGGMFGFEDLSVFVHDIENAFELIRNEKLKFDKEIADLTFAACDQMQGMIFKDKSKKVNEQEVKRIIEAFRTLTNKEKQQDDEPQVKKSSRKKINTEKARLFRVKFYPAEDIFNYGIDPIILIKDIQVLGECMAVGKLRNNVNLENLDPEKCNVYWDLFLYSSQTLDAIKDVFIFVEDSCETDIKEYKCKVADFSDNVRSKLYPILQKGEDLTDQQLEQLISEDEQKTKEAKSGDGGQGENKSIRVSSDKLDDLVNLVGELVTVQAGLSQLINVINDAKLMSLSEQMERLTSDLRDSTLNIRMLPIGTTFSKFNRLVRDLSRDLKKEVELTTEGAETELDKNIIEKLNDPLVHIIRNSIDHGIEDPDDRAKKSKSRKGRIHLAAKQTGGNVIIQISDDGAGLNRKAVKAKAVKQGLIAEDAELTDQEIVNLIFKAGFSTSQNITNVSGRGVGMDVVKQAIEQLRGTVDVISKENQGTTISIKLPLTLAIIDGLLTEINNEFFVLPLIAVEECVEISREDEIKRNNRHILNLRDEIVPYIRLREQFEVESPAPLIEQVVIVNVDGFRFGVVVDEVKGQHQTVLKSLGKAFKDVEGISGATILGDGSIALILDLLKLAQLQETKEKEIYS